MSETTTAYVLSPFAYGRGYPTVSTRPNPGAGNPARVLVPGSRAYRLLSVQATLTTSAVVASRTPMVQLLDGDLIEWLRLSPSASVVASTTTLLVWHVGMATSYTSGSGGLYSPLPDVFIPEGHTIQLSAVNLDAGDTLTTIKMFWEELVVGGGGYRPGRVTASVPTPEP